jgi:hypothetical protein
MSVKDCYWWSSEPQVEPPVEMFLFLVFFGFFCLVLSTTIILTFPVFQSWNVQYKSDASKPCLVCRVQLERSVLWSGISTEIGDVFDDV